MVTRTESELLALALTLGAQHVAGWSEAERALVERTVGGLPVTTLDDNLKRQVVSLAIGGGNDPLGETLCGLRPAAERRELGAVYTPPAIISAMLRWAARQPAPRRVVDPGAGSARFLVAAGRQFPTAQLVGVELDPMAAILARAHLAAAGMARRSQIICGDYRDARLPDVDGPTLYLGNPPYVRHHQIEPVWKQWLTATARVRGYDASQLAGLHAHFFLATAMHARPGDVGVFVTAAEWLDVNYGRLIRELLLRDLGLETLVMIEPKALPFEGTATTAVITGFRVAQPVPQVRMGRAAALDQLDDLQPTGTVRRERLEAEPRWTVLIRGGVERRAGHIQLGELFRVHRGQVTGKNRVWIAGPHSRDLPPSVLFATVTRARELIRSGDVLTEAVPLKQVIDLPAHLDLLAPEERQHVERFLAYARAQGAADTYIARHRKAWWAVGLRAPAPILATYMARRPPVFVQNQAEARHLNIAHGLYPREPLPESLLRGIATFLNQNVALAHGRTYAGGLTKFEPREMERLLIPEPAQLAQELAHEVAV
ncbi:MAG TPA: N-6 DNA methylase [Chloroflexaceae bacterium]|nr:N-6 DNA methylase [Chloroflexaceae bacterium]